MGLPLLTSCLFSFLKIGKVGVTNLEGNILVDHDVRKMKVRSTYEGKTLVTHTYSTLKRTESCPLACHYLCKTCAH